MIACLFGKTGHVAIVPVEQRRTVNSERYTTICLPVVFQERKENQPPKTDPLYHDNASSHTSAQTTVFLSTKNIDLMSHPPYSPDLAPKMHVKKHKMRGQRFSTPQETVDAFRMHVMEIPKSEWFDNWFKRM